ncbi:hypothetical protein BJ508DRAFT_416108 [Ascobolus immersus RN42]|uniref:Adenylyltransferase and sulfurtransferase uba4 n=1 Tax=Ascobolus immersus RN42 TaxID=1160509 RepID=A0A3N4I3D2_ASCIM|nr:hypothetical protein BJ508DRAFT_416108 [Ascobolus immersus RN42]
MSPSPSRQEEIASLRQRLAELEQQEREAQQAATREEIHDESIETKPTLPLPLADYTRYSRQLLLPQIGLPGQIALRNAKVLIVGLGGLGSPATLYLAGAGVGTLGLIDGDTVEESNLHRQIAHSEDRVGQYKVDSAAAAVAGLNSGVKVRVWREHLNTGNVLRVLEKEEEWDLVLDCTDHPSVRYLLSDAAVLTGKTVVSASALRWDGQLTVLNDPVGEGPCYRCVWPNVPEKGSVVGCGEGGILGPVVGVMGVLQAIEAIKVLVSRAPKKEVEEKTESTKREYRMTLLSSYPTLQFRSVRLLGKRKTCPVCGENKTITRETIETGSDEYIQACGGLPSEEGLELLDPVTERIDVLTFKDKVYDSESFVKRRVVVVDTRPKVEYGICKLPTTNQYEEEKAEMVNVPMEELDFKGRPSWLPVPEDQWAPKTDVYFVCKQGNDSQIAVKKFKEASKDWDFDGEVRDIIGGIRAWGREVDDKFPIY